MYVHGLPRKLFVVLLVAAAVVIGCRLGAPGAAGATGQPVAAVPPVLPAATTSEMALIRQVEAQEAAASAYDPAASARYSVAALNGYK